ncbi:MAG: Ig-like domain-containing protein [Armatimonadetes bacterium]|nr:Ig-like domain-containing protein [Armatimonadota bacterium]
MTSRDGKRALGLTVVGLWVASLGFVPCAYSASPAQVLGTHQDCVHVAWRPVSACLEDWDPQMMRYPAPTSYLPGIAGYPRIMEGPNDGETPKYIECYTYKSFSGRPVSAALAFATWGYRVSWFEQAANGFVYRGSYLVPALWIRDTDRQTGTLVYREVRAGRYSLLVPPKGSLRAATSYRITIEPLKIIVHEWLDFEDASTCMPSFSPLIPSDITFQPLVILWPKGPKWYYGLTSLIGTEQAFAEPQVSWASDMPVRSYDQPPADRTRYHYEGDDMWSPQTFDEIASRNDLFLRKTYWWFGQPASRGDGRGGVYWYPVCGVRGYMKQRGGEWESFGAQGPRVMCELAVTTLAVPLEVSSTYPQNGQRAVPLDSTVEVKFNKRLTYHNPSAIRWTDAAGNRVEFTAQLSGDGRVLSLKPCSRLSQNTDYRVVVPRDAVRANQEILAADFSFAFSTRPASGGGGGGGPGGPHHQ